MAESRFVGDKSLTFNCDLNLGHGNLNSVCGIPSHFVLTFS